MPEVSEPMVRCLPAVVVVQVRMKCIQDWSSTCGFCVCVLLKEPPKEDLTVSEKFQLVLDVAQKAQVQRGSSNDPTAARNKTNSLMRCF